MLTLYSRGISKIWALSIVVVILVVGSLLIISITRKPTTSETSYTTTPTTQSSTSTITPTSSSTTSSFQSALSSPNTSVFVDDSQTSAPDGLDPAFGFAPPDVSFFASVFQELVEFNGSSVVQVVPALASGYNVSNGYQNYTFTIRPNVSFSNGDPLTAADVWFSFVRELYDGQAVGIANYLGLTMNGTSFAQTGYALPWGLRSALAYATGNQAVLTNTTLMAEYLNNIMSNFNPDNATIQHLIGYPNQAYVVSGPMTFRINLLVHYSYFLTDVASWWGAIVDPAYVDSHGGVQANSVNTYFDSNGGPGTGPYMVKSVESSLSSITLIKNPNYWNHNSTSTTPNLEAAHIPVVIINYGLPHTDRVEEFATNQAQMSYVSIPFFGQMYNSYQYKNLYSFNQILFNASPPIGFYALEFNTQRFPTNNTDLRFALVHAINYTAILNEAYSYDGKPYAQEYYGPVSPVFPIFRQLEIPNYQYNINLAAKYLNMSLWQMGYQVTMPNGTVLGNPTKPVLPPIPITVVAPVDPGLQAELEIIISGFSQIGVQASIAPITLSVLISEITSPKTSPISALTPFYPDWPDPYDQLIDAAFTTLDGLVAWMNVSTLNSILYSLPFLTNATQQLQEAKYVYNYTYYYAPYAWTPTPDNYFFIQPYVRGAYYNPISGYSYNSIYYSNT
jgi:peptide/nickel transport system substrate-binding protein